MTTSPEQAGVIHAYHLSSAEHAISNIRLGRLKVARIAELNDPFELLALSCMDRKQRRALAAFKNSQDQETGLLSFSKNWKNPVLWSHYGDRGKGIALGFDIKRTIGSRGLLEVNYQDLKLKPLVEDLERGSISPEVQELLYVTKFSHWKYESEVRAILPLSNAAQEGPMWFWPFSDELRLTDVILGPLCSESVGSVAAVVRKAGSDASVVKARLGYKYFHVKPADRQLTR
jgi:hypothetical protein